MTRHLQTIGLVFALALASSAIVRAQEKPAAAPAKTTVRVESPSIPLKLQILVSRYQGEKRVSSLPYSLSVTAGSRGNLRMGAKIPVVMIRT